MKKIIKISLAIIFFNLAFPTISFSDNAYFIDFKKVLNQSDAGKKAQDFLKKKFESESKKFKKQEENLKKEEKELIAKKKLITNEEYLKKVKELRKRVSDLQKAKSDSLNNIAKLRSDAKNKLEDALNPIIKKYMEDNNIRIVIDKKAVLLGDTKLEITSQIIEILNKELKSLKIN